MSRTSYKTTQKDIVSDWLATHSDTAHSVDELCESLTMQGKHIGRTTIYRYLEFGVKEGTLIKYPRTNTHPARYRLADTKKHPHGQLACISCGSALTLDCDMLDSFSSHVKDHHGFSIDDNITVLYGLCSQCNPHS